MVILTDTRRYFGDMEYHFAPYECELSFNLPCGLKGDAAGFAADPPAPKAPPEASGLEAARFGHAGLAIDVISQSSCVCLSVCGFCLLDRSDHFSPTGYKRGLDIYGGTLNFIFDGDE
jgi:hypothetical protein